MDYKADSVTLNEERDDKESIITGIFKFDHKVTIDELKEVAEEWAKDPKYLQLYIRKVSKDQYGIGFMYDNKENPGDEKSYEEYFNKTTDMLKRKFGNDLRGWDLSSSTIVIK